MNHEQLIDSVTELLGFRVSERENDAVVIQGKKVRPATRAEVSMFTAILGFARRLNDFSWACSEIERAKNEMGGSLQAADVQIKQLLQANHGLGEEQVHAETRISALEEKVRQLRNKLEHATERAESAEEMASQMNSQLSDAERVIREQTEIIHDLEKSRMDEMTEAELHEEARNHE